MLRKILAILFYICAGFFVYLMSFVAYIKSPTPGLAKTAVIGVFAIPATVFMLIGLATERFTRWRQRLAVVLYAGAGTTAFTIGMYTFLLLEPEFRNMVSPEAMAMLSGSLSGAAAVLVFILIGLVLIIIDKRIAAASRPQ